MPPLFFSKLSYFKEIYGKSKLRLKAYFYPRKGHWNLEYQDGGDELQNLIAEITAMNDRGLLISMVPQLPQGTCI